MSDLPRYTRTPKVDESETEALVKKARGSFDLEDEEEQAPSYPPRAGPSGSGLKNVTYEFDPVYPMEGDHQHVLGVLGRDKEETILLVRRAFEALQEIPDDRIIFHASFGESPPTWSRLMEEVWPQFAENPPTRISVRVKDGPGDAAKRQKHNFCVGVTVITFVGALFAIIYFLISIFAGPPPAAKQTTSV